MPLERSATLARHFALRSLRLEKRSFFAALSAGASLQACVAEAGRV